MYLQLKKSTGKSHKIVITNDKGRLSKEEIEKMVKDAENFKDADEAQAKIVEAKNGLEHYCYSMKQTLNEEKLKSVFQEEEKKTIETKIDEVLKWMNDNPAAKKEEYEAKTKELEGIFNPIMARVYQATGGQGVPNMGNMGGGMPNFGGPDFQGTGTNTGSSKSGVDDVD